MSFILSKFSGRGFQFDRKWFSWLGCFTAYFRNMLLTNIQGPILPRKSRDPNHPSILKSIESTQSNPELSFMLSFMYSQTPGIFVRTNLKNHEPPCSWPHFWTVFRTKINWQPKSHISKTTSEHAVHIHQYGTIENENGDVNCDGSGPHFYEADQEHGKPENTPPER